MRVSKKLCSLVDVGFVSGSSGKKIATITLNSPKSLNAMTVSMGEDFKRAVAEVKANADVRAVVLTGAGSAFSAGGDVNFLNDRISDTRENNIAAMRAFYDRFLSIRTLPVPVVAGLNGHAIGAGFCVALACDIRVASEKAKFAINFTRLGIHPGMGATYFLPKLVGHSTASRLILTGETLNAAELKNLGLVSHVNEPEKVLSTAIEQADMIASASGIAVREALMTLRGGDSDALPAALQREAEAQAACYAQGKDLKEALTAIKEKRSPRFD